ncbi:MAG: Gmad2 immunoglobulin-like domain-containing protein [Acidimicrobiia bacterium]
MRGMTRLLTVALVLGGCSTQTVPTDPDATLPPAPQASTTQGTIPPVTTTAVAPPNTTQPEALPPCLGGETPFTDSGLVATLGTGVGDAASIGSVRWEAHEGCERIVVELLTEDGAPSGSVGESSVAFRPDQGIIRIDLPVSATGVADASIEGDLAERVFVVRTPQGDLSVEVHLGTADPIVVRASEVGEPARLVVDIARSEDGTGRIVGPVVEDNVVLVAPAPGPARYPLQISGYARTFEANVVARLVVDGAIAGTVSTTAADWLEAWGEFTMSFESGPPGDVTLVVGEVNAADGRFVGAAIRLQMP